MSSGDAAQSGRRKRALITGASSGLGRAITVELSAKWDLILWGRDCAELENTAAQCDPAARISTIAHDLSDVEGIGAKLSGAVEAEDLRINAFVHSAGIMHLCPLRSLDEATVEEQMSINFSCAFELVRLLSLKRLNHGALGDIIFISSAATRLGEKALSIYSASKGALEGLTKSLAAELSPRVRVNSILPGLIETPLSRAWMESTPEETIQGLYPLGVGKPENVAKLAGFLLSDDAGWITGQSFVLDGGRTLT